MATKNDALKVNPLIAELAKRPTATGLVELQGYVGPSDQGVVRLYRSLAMDSYVEVPRADVADAAVVEGSTDGRVRLHVHDDAEATEVSTRRMRVGQYTMDPSPELPGFLRASQYPKRRCGCCDPECDSFTISEAKKDDLRLFLIRWARMLRAVGVTELDCARWGPDRGCCQTLNRLLDVAGQGGNEEFDAANTVLAVCLGIG